MPRALLAVLELALVIYCLVDCIQTDEGRMRNLPKVAWILLILLIPYAGPIAWLLAGRPQGGNSGARPSTPSQWHAAASSRVVAPDDDPQFLAQLHKNDREHEAMLKRWEEDLKRREADLREPGDDERRP